MSSNLMLSKKAQRVSREELATVPVPDSTRTWCPVGHNVILDLVVDRLADAGYSEINKMDLGLTADGARFFGVLDMAAPICNGDSGGVSLSIGVRNALDKAFSASMCGGQRVFVCDNLMMTGTVMALKKHTHNILEVFEEKLCEAVGQLGSFISFERIRVAWMMEQEITEAQVHDLVVKTADARVIPWSYVPRVLNEWREPCNDEFSPRTLWSLTDSFTEVFKSRFERNPESAARETIKLNSVVKTWSKEQVTGVTS